MNKDKLVELLDALVQEFLTSEAYPCPQGPLPGTGQGPQAMTIPRLRGTEETGPNDPEEGPMKECEWCRGSGKADSREIDRDCPFCHGTGLVPDDREPAPEADTTEEKRGEA